MSRVRFQGEEEGIARIEDNVVFTPFNLREEQSEGHFDEGGTYIFKKQQNEVEDSWVQDLDNCQIADPSKFKKMGNDDESVEPYNQVSNSKKLLVYMERNETVKAAIRRLGSKISELRKANRLAKNKEVAEKIKEETSKVEVLTSLADQALFNGQVQIYEKTYEELEKQGQQPTASTSGANKPEEDAEGDKIDEENSDEEEEKRKGLKRKNEFEESSDEEEEEPSESSTDDDEI